VLPLGAIRVLVVLAAETAEDDTTVPALDRALRASFGGEAAISVEHARSAGDGVLEEEARSREATLLCVVAWSDGLRRATLHFYRPRERRWSDREIRFDPNDAGAERGRTLGFAIASIVPDGAIRPADEAPAVPPPSPPPRERPSHPSVGGPSFSTYARPALELTGNATVAIGGSGGGFGGGLAARFGLSRAIAVRVGLGARVAELHAAQATSRNYAGSVGIAWSRPLTAAGRVRVGGRVDACIFAQQVVHLSSDDPAPDGRVRVLPGAVAAVEGAWQLADQAALVAAFGPEIAFGGTDVVVRGRQVAELVPVRLFGEAGLRVSF
jgi:hypothetical protein